MGFAYQFTKQAAEVLFHLREFLPQETEKRNPWFAPPFVKHRLDSLQKGLKEERDTLVHLFSMEIGPHAPCLLSIVAAGNLPLVCWHDLICCLAYAAAHPKEVTVEIKLSSKDDVLLPAFINALAAQKKSCLEGIPVQFVKYISHNTGAILFTGGVQAQAYYSLTFSRVPLLMRTGRTSLALLNGDESEEELYGLAEDCFLYFGLGCRNVSLLLVPPGYDFEPFARQVEAHFGSLLKGHKGYMNALRHARACQTLTTEGALTANPVPAVAWDLFVLENNATLAPPMGTLHYLEYEEAAVAEHFIKKNRDLIQCVVGKGKTPFGQTQTPLFTDFADGLNTLEWLQKLSY
ncbi:MAG: hypothetical protein GX877_01970 [Bacteroidales bacterium]|nr:hypothetical protein [Bacteroidales bacterium]